MNNNNIIGGIRGNIVLTFSHYTVERNQINNILQEGILDRYLIGEGIIPYNFNYNENVNVRNDMIIDLNQNRFIYENRDISDILSNAVQNNFQNNNLFNIIVLKSLRINGNNLDDLGILIRDMLN